MCSHEKLRFDTVKHESSEVKKVIKVVSEFNTRYSRRKEMVLKCLLCDFIISDLLKWRVLERCNKEPSTLIRPNVVK